MPGPLPPPLTPPQPPAPNRRVWLLIGLAGSVSAALVVSYIGLAVAPQFESVYRSFGAQMPATSQLFMRFFGLAWLLPAGVLAIGRCWPRPNAPVIAGVLGLVAPFVAVPVALLLIYLPLFRLADV